MENTHSPASPQKLVAQVCTLGWKKKVLNGPVITTDGFSTFHPLGKLLGTKRRGWFV